MKKPLLLSIGLIFTASLYQCNQSELTEESIAIISNFSDAILSNRETIPLANAGWNRDRYEDLPTLKANSKMLVADIKGPAIITQVHTTKVGGSRSSQDRKKQQDFARSVIIEIWFDDADNPAVHVPLADFFGDGCNGSAIPFSTRYIENAHDSYNAYFAMPFKKRARIYLRNDTDTNLLNYTYVESEKLPRWNNKYGYFHATYNRKTFQLTKNTVETFFIVKGKGHLLGRQWSICTHDPHFPHFSFIMEANNEVQLDSSVRKLDYLGTEDSFGFSWGFKNTFIGHRAGITYIEKSDTVSKMSIYRFHDHMPLRFKDSLSWELNWQYEYKDYKKQWVKLMPELEEAEKNDGVRVDYASVWYWYMSEPKGYIHQPIESVQESRMDIAGKPDTRKYAKSSQ